jgi:(2Fe-2S) ferredoxin
MEETRPKFEKYVFVCVNERLPGGKFSCGGSSCGKELAAGLKEEVKKAGQENRIRVSKTLCLDVCEQGPNVLIYPDNIWFKKMGVRDIPAVLEKLGIQA